MRRTVIAAILLVWLVALGLLLLPHPGRAPDLPVASGLPAPSAAGTGRWFEIYLQGHKVGFVHHSVERLGDHYRFFEKSVLRMKTLGTQQTIHSTAWGSLTDAFELRDMNLALATGPTTFEASVDVEGPELVIRTESGGKERRLRLPVDDTVFLPIGLRSALLRQPLKKGLSTGGQVIDPLTRSKSRLGLTVVGREPLPGQTQVTAWRVEETWRDVRSVLWVDDDGNLLREEGPIGLVAVAASEASATQFDEGTDAGWDAVEAVSIPVAVPIENPRQRPELRVRLTGIGDRRVPVGDGQAMDGGVLTVKRADLRQVRSYALPYAGSAYVDELEATYAVQSDHPRVRALARTILGPEHDALSATLMLVQWVHEYLEKIPIASLPDALETLDRGSGDCTEHTVLFAALARAAGIPTRLVAGTVYGDGAFLYHAWAEVWVDRWLPVDPALLQVPADATHIKLAEGDLEEQMVLTALLGTLGIELVREGD